MHRSSLSWLKIREDGIGVQARAGGVTPSAMVRLKSKNHPAIASRIFASRKRPSKDFILIGLLIKVFTTLEHRTHLHTQVGEGRVRSIRQRHANSQSVPVRCR